jgi:putative peptidoglycan lipid II flippase
MLYKGLLDCGVYRPVAGWRRLLWQLGGASFAMCAVLLGLLHVLDGWLEWAWYERVGYLSLLVGTGILTYFGVLYACGLRSKDFHIEIDD